MEMTQRHMHANIRLDSHSSGLAVAPTNRVQTIGPPHNRTNCGVLDTWIIAVHRESI